MPEPFKNLFNPTMIAQMGGHLSRVDADFDADRFIALATKNLETLELKERSNQIRDALSATLPNNFRTACKILVDALHPDDTRPLGDLAMDDQGISGWAIMPMADYVAASGMEDFDHGLDVLADLTKRFSSEFAIRHFYIADTQRTLKKSLEWTKDDNEHIRRLASEGCRPRLPWGLQLTDFVRDPAPLLPLLEALKDDPSEYVRRSVANNINDIAKDHPDLVAKLAKDWLKAAPAPRQHLVKHACRTLIKQGHKPTLAALGYGKPEVEVEDFTIHTPIVELGNTLEFSLTLTSQTKTAQPLILDFIIHHQKANGQTTPKTLKWKLFELAGGKTINLTKKHPMKPITTRKYYGGEHGVEIVINGVSFGRGEFELVV